MQRKLWLSWVTLFCVVLLGFQLVQVAAQHRQSHMIYSDFLDQAAQGKVQSVKVSTSGDVLTAQFRDDKPPREVVGPGKTEIISRDLDVAHKICQSKGTGDFQVDYVSPPAWHELLRSLLFVLPIAAVLVVLYVVFMKNISAGNSQAMQFNRSRARKLDGGLPRKTFDDVAGVDEAKEELAEIVDFLKHAEKYKKLGAEIPKGVLLMGPPGCGKTLLARAVAGEADVSFYHISGSDFVEMFVGVGASRVRDLFEQAKGNRPCIVFIDELDAVGRQRGAGVGGGHDEREQTVNQLLVEMDGFEPNAGIIVMAATNRPDILDPALLRPGRFDRRVVVDAPDFGGRQEILGLYLKTRPVADDINVDGLARQTAGLTGADLFSVVNEASILAARLDHDKVAMADFEEAIERVVAGRERRSRVLTPTERRAVAFHEAGHAILAHVLPNCPMVHKVTILPRGMALGYVMTLPDEERFNRNRAELLALMTQMLGGRVAEELVYGNDGITTGAQNDLERVTELARSIVCDYGMSDEIGPRTMGRRHGPVFLGRDLVEDRNYSEEMAHLIDMEIRRFVDDCYAEAREVLTARREQLDHLVEVLLERETLNHDEVIEVLGPAPEKVGLAAEPISLDSGA